MKRSRNGEGASLIEAVTYRLSDHTTADDATRYRADEEVSARWKEEPISRLKKYLTDHGAWAREDEEALLNECASHVDEAVEAYLATPSPGPDSMFEHLFAALPAGLESQRHQAEQSGLEETNAQS